MVLTSKALFGYARWWIVFVACAVPLLSLVLDASMGRLGADPAKEIVQQTGFWALVLIWLGLAVTPVVKVLKQRWLMKFRRMVGLYAFFYSILHLLSFCTFILGWRGDLILTELTKRPYIVIGLIALLILIPLAITSTKAMQKRLGRRWKVLHKGVYLVAVLSMVHFAMQVRASYQEQVIFFILLLLLFALRRFSLPQFGFMAFKKR